MKPRLLIVDDDLNVVRQLKWTFHDQYEVVHALTRADIESVLAESMPVAALIDMHLPPTLHTAETGLDFVRMVHRSHPELLVIGISVAQDPSIPETLKDAGASFFLPKPFSSESLKSLLDRA
jgi:DNA-binding NtrC family response regulator